MQKWYSHLPPALRFPVDASPLFDLRKAFLRSQYLCLFILMGWPSVLEILELGESHVRAGGNGNDAELSSSSSSSASSMAVKQAKDCLSSCALLVDVADEILSRRNLGTQLILWA
jgi:hypothetical protein